MSSATATPRKRVLSQQAVLDRVPVSRTTLWRMERAGLFPRRIQVSTNRVGWLEADVDAWVERKEERQVKRRDPPLGSGGSQYIGSDFCGLQAACKPPTTPLGAMRSTIDAGKL